MSRSAILTSLTLHALVLLLVGGRLTKPAIHAGPGESGAGVSFIAELPAAPLLVEATPVAEPQADAETQPADPQISLPTPSVLTSALPAENIPRENFHPVPPAASAALTLTPRRSAASSAGKTGARKTGAGAGGSGAGLAGSGRGGGGPGYTPPQFRLRYKAPYPDEARAQRLEGTVLLLVRVDAEGRVAEAAVRQSCGHSILDRAALEAVRLWRFYPARQDGSAVIAQVEVPVSFRFEENRAARI